MRVLTIGNIYPPESPGGGYELTWRSWVEHMRRRSHEVRVLTTDFRTEEPDPGVPEDPDVHRQLQWYWRDGDYPRIGLGTALRLERYNAAVLERHLASFRPQAVCWWAMGGMSLSLIEWVRRRGLAAAGVVGDPWMSYGPRKDGWLTRFHGRRRRLLAPLGERIWRLPAKIDLSAAGPWLFNSRAMLQDAERAGWRLADARIVHPGVDRQLFRPSTPPPWRWRLAVVGRIDPRKGIETAIEALAQLPEEAGLTIVGRGDEAHRRELEALAAERGLERRVIFTARARPELPAVYEEADAILFPVRWEEPWGLVPLEAMAVGRPVVATGTGGSREYLADGENCVLFDWAEGAPALAAALHRLAGDEDLRLAIRNGGMATAARFTERDYCEAIEDVIVEAAGGSASA